MARTAVVMSERNQKGVRTSSRRAQPKRSLTQISARVPGDLKLRFDQMVERKGLRKEFVIEEALRHHLAALEELPDEYIIPPRMVLTPESSRRVAKALANPPRPSQALTSLLRGSRRAGDH